MFSPWWPTTKNISIPHKPMGILAFADQSWVQLGMAASHRLILGCRLEEHVFLMVTEEALKHKSNPINIL